MTNAERIRKMTDEELAEWLVNLCQFYDSDEELYKSIYSIDAGHEENIRDSYGDLLQWVKKETIQCKIVKDGAKDD